MARASRNYQASPFTRLTGDYIEEGHYHNCAGAKSARLRTHNWSDKNTRAHSPSRSIHFIKQNPNGKTGLAPRHKESTHTHMLVCLVCVYIYKKKKGGRALHPSLASVVFGMLPRFFSARSSSPLLFLRASFTRARDKPEVLFLPGRYMRV